MKVMSSLSSFAVSALCTPARISRFVQRNASAFVSIALIAAAVLPTVGVSAANQTANHTVDKPQEWSVSPQGTVAAVKPLASEIQLMKDSAEEMMNEGQKLSKEMLEGIAKFEKRNPKNPEIPLLKAEEERVKNDVQSHKKLVDKAIAIEEKIKQDAQKKQNSTVQSENRTY